MRDKLAFVAVPLSHNTRGLRCDIRLEVLTLPIVRANRGCLCHLKSA